MPVSRQQFAAALAQGVNPGIFENWAPLLPRTARVMVPIRVDALVVRQAGGVWADCRLREPEVGTAALDAAELLPQPFANLPEGRQAGVYLHWALPDALTRGVAGANPDNGADFPAIPDRWLVARIGGSDRFAGRRAVAAWVIESGGATPKATALAAWTEPGPGQATNQPLTALGHGDPAWAAYFDNVVGRLGFFDPLAGVAQGPLAYLVCGWYSSSALDPLGDAINSVARFERRLAELRWEVPAGSYGYASGHQLKMQAMTATASRTAAKPDGPADRFTVDAGPMLARPQPHVSRPPLDFLGKPIHGYFSMGDGWWPKQTLCHGGVVGLGWPHPGLEVAKTGALGGVEVGGPPPASLVRVAFGHSLTDALAALLAANGQSPDQARAVEMALLGASDQLNEPDAPSQVDVRVHAACFGALPSAPTTETVRQTPPGEPAPQRHVDPSRTKPGIFAGKVPRPGKAGSPMSNPAMLETTIEAGVLRTDNPKIGGVKVWANRRLVDIVAEVKADRLGGERPPPRDAAPRDVEVARASPRFFVPSDPVILVQGVGRSFKHGGDRLNAQSGNLPCRVSGMVTRRLSPAALRSGAGDGAVTGADLLAGGIHHGGVPIECGELLSELALLDPGSAPFAARAGARGRARMSAIAVEQAAQVYAVEQTAWWATWDPRRDSALFAAKSGFDGVLPCGLAVTPPLRPWVPLHLDWEVEYVPTPAGADDWELGEIDFDVRPSALPGGTATDAVLLTGRALLTGGAAQTAAAAVRQTLDKSASAGGSAALTPGLVVQFHSELARALLVGLGNLSTSGPATAADPNPGDLRSLADSLAEMDILAGALDNFHTRLRGGFVGDGRAAPAEESPAPDPFIPLRAGFLRVRRLRLVDCFGQVLNLAGSSETSPVDMTKVVRSEPMSVAGRPELLELAPRFTAPARLMFRFVGADDDAVEATDALSPVCGFLLPDHLDAELQFHGANGGALGSVRFDPATGVAWEIAPGLPTPLGADPGRTIANQHLARLAQGLLDWGMADVTRDDPGNVDTALSALLRIVDTTLWTVDPFGHTGEEHLSLLVGHPVAVLRARLTLEVTDPIRSDALQRHRVPVRLGSLAHWQDGLLGYFVDDDYMTLRLPDPAAAGFARPLGPGQGFLGQATQTSSYYANFASEIGLGAVAGDNPVKHDFVDPAGIVFIRPGQTISLTLLVEPHSLVNATCGLLPRKAIGMRRQWVAPGLASIAPIFRFGPILVEPKRIRMPVASELNGSWSWCHRIDPVTWQEDEVVNSRGDTQLPTSRVEGQEGWLRLTPEKPGGES